MAKGDVIAGSGSLPDSFGRNSVKERINVNERQELPLYMRASSYRPHKEVISVKMKGERVLHSDKMTQNKSDYTQRGEK